MPSSLEDYCDIPSVTADAVAAADTSDSYPPLSTVDPLAKAAAIATETNLGARENSWRGGRTPGVEAGAAGAGQGERLPSKDGLAGQTLPNLAKLP